MARTRYFKARARYFKARQGSWFGKAKTYSILGGTRLRFPTPKNTASMLSKKKKIKKVIFSTRARYFPGRARYFPGRARYF